MTMKNLILVGLVLLAACSPVRATTDSIAPITNQVYATQLGSTLWGVEQALAGRAGTAIMSRGDNYLFIWSVKDAFAFVGVNSKGISMTNAADVFANGNLVDVKTLKQLQSGLSDSGWQIVKNTDVPSKIITLFQAGASVLLRELAKLNATFLVLPAGLLEDFIDIEMYRSVKG